MSFLKRLNDVRNYNQSKEEEIKQKIVAIKQQIIEKKKQMEAENEEKKKKQIAEMEEKKKKQKEKPIKEDFEITCDEFIISIDDIINDRPSLHTIYCNGEKYQAYINPFQILASIPITYTIGDVKLNCIIPFKFDYPLATREKENDIIVITYKYIYKKDYIGQRTTLTDLGFNCEIPLYNALYTNVYYFKNEYGKFRIDLDIEIENTIKEDFNITCEVFEISMDKIKKDTMTPHTIYCNGKKYQGYTNPFQLLVSNPPVIYDNGYQQLILIPPFKFNNTLATYEKEDDIIVIKFKYVYSKDYKGETASLTDLGFDYVVTLVDNKYIGVYEFVNHYGKFRIDLEIELK